MFAAVSAFIARFLPGGSILAAVAPYAIALLLGGGLVVGIYQTGRNSARRECQEAALRAERDAALRDLEITKQAASDAERRADDMAKEAAADDKRIRDLEADIAKRPAGNRCGLSRDDARRLRGVAR